MHAYLVPVAATLCAREQNSREEKKSKRKGNKERKRAENNGKVQNRLRGKRGKMTGGSRAKWPVGWGCSL